MKIKLYKYTWEDDGRKVFMLFESVMGFKGVSIIGSVFKKGHSNNDIDVSLAGENPSEEIIDKILKAFRYPAYEITDWGSLYLHNTIFGNIDIFFKGQTEHFDY